MVLAIPRGDRDRLKQINVPNGVEILYCRRYANDYLGQQITKLHADEHCSADYICHVDSDCVFREKIMPIDLFKNEKPTWVFSNFESIPGSSDWQAMTERFIGFDVANDYMRRQPLCFPRAIYPALRKFCLEQHHLSILEYVLDCSLSGFSEYNALGAFAHKYYPHWFSWVDKEDGNVDEQFCRWFWSWGGVSKEIREEMSQILAIPQT